MGVLWRVTLDLSEDVRDTNGSMTAGQALQAACAQIIDRYGDREEGFCDLSAYVYVGQWADLSDGD